LKIDVEDVDEDVSDSFFAHEINETNKMNNPMNRYNLLYIEASYWY